MKQKILFAFLSIAVILGLVSCDSLWKVSSDANIRFSLSKEALIHACMASPVRSIDSDDVTLDDIEVIISLYNASGDTIIDSKNVTFQDDDTVEVLFENLEIVGETVYAKIEATIEGVTYVAASESKVMLAEGNVLAIDVDDLEMLVLKVATPVITQGVYSDSIQTISITCETEGAQIFYTTDGSNPIDYGIEYSKEIRRELAQGDSLIIKAYATKRDLEDSSIAETTITTDAGQVEPPTFSYSSGNYDFSQPMGIFTFPPDATIYYTMDGTDPTRESTSGYSIDLSNAPSPVTVKAFAVREGMIDSEIASATWYNTNQDRFFTINDEGIITAYDSENGPAGVIVPSTVRGIDVKGFEATLEVFKNNTKITSVVLAEGIENILESAFAGCTSLTSIAIPSSVENIGANAFSACSSLATVTIPDTVDSIGTNAFANSALTTVYTDAIIADKEDEWNKTTNALLFAATWIQFTDESLFTFENGTITDFDDTQGVTNVVVPSTIGGEKVETIGSRAFEGKHTIESIVISEGITKIEGSAFDNCDMLTTISVPSTVAQIEYAAFGSANYPLTVIDVSPANATYVSKDGVLFSKAGETLFALMKYPNSKVDTEYSIPDTIKTIESQAFHGVDLLQMLTIPASVTSIEQDALDYSLRALTLINVDSANANYESTDGVLFSKGGTTLMVYPRGKAAQNSSYIIPPGVKIIGDSAFELSKLTGVTIPNTVTTIGERAFAQTTLTTLTIPASVTSIEEFALGSLHQLSSISVDSRNTSFVTYNDVLYTASGDTLILCPVAKTGSLTALAAVKTIANGAFDGSSLSEVILPEGLVEIENWAFANADVSTVILPETLTTIGVHAFNSCSNLTEITLHDSVTTIWDGAFIHTGLTTVHTNYAKDNYPEDWREFQNELLFNATWIPIP